MEVPMAARITALAETKKPLSQALVLALHCSGASGRQWQTLSSRLSGSAEVVAPDLIGTTTTGPWCGAQSFSLADEARPIMALVETFSDPIHLVGHS
jgi:pimeloyl-ACP methyl ester carboxylesterase